ncbi:MAG: glycosyltransferase [Pseudomonadota bacterium]
MLFVTILALAAWVYLVFFRHGFWRSDQVLPAAKNPEVWPSVAVVIPARNEAETVRQVVEAHRSSDYPGKLDVLVCNDSSEDETTAEAEAAQGNHASEVLTVPPLSDGWTGKLWALNAGTEALANREAPPDYILFTDADILAGPGLLKKLVAVAERDKLALTSIMAQLDASGFWGGALVPAFIYFFQKLYPFPAINNPQSGVAGAAGGVVLIKREALEAIGGVASLRGALIDDCTLAERVKRNAPGTKIGLYLSSQFAEAVSLRNNESYGAMETMVARSAYAQLNNNPLLLLGTLIGLALVYLVPVAAFLGGPFHNSGPTFWAGFAALALMIVSYGPTLKRYGKSRREAFLLPFAAVVYGWFTWLSGWRAMRGKGNSWKGRSYGA